MADSDTPPPSSARPGPVRESRGRDPAGSKGVDARVRQQRRHIEGLDGRDPLRPGIDD